MNGAFVFGGLMSFRTLVLTFTTLAFATFSVPSLSAKADKEAAALEAATQWLKIVDTGDYAASWAQAATFFKSKVTESQWKVAAESARKPLGKFIDRKLKSKTYLTELPGAPKGDYVVIQFDTMFEKNKTAVETITPMLDSDKKWRVSGYYIR